MAIANNTRTVQSREVLSRFELNTSQLTQVRNRITEQLILGLKKNEKASLKMLPTYVEAIPNGNEMGDYLALDLGGTNFRVLRVKLPGKGGGQIHVDSQIYTVPSLVMQGSGDKLFDHIAECIENFMETHNLFGRNFPLGFTFSFPCVQKGLDKSILLRWTKGYNAANVVGEDIVSMLDAAITRRKQQSNLDYSIEIKAVINDTVGTMMSCAYSDQECSIGLIIGTGTNACYMEDSSAIEQLNSETEDDSTGVNMGALMCVNTEWGGFGENGSLDFVKTECDRKVDEESINPGAMIYEKMIGGMYMGEVARHLIIELIQSEALFGGKVTETIKTKGKFLSAFITQIESDRSASLKNCKQILNNLDYTNSTLDERIMIKEACTVVSTRAAYLCASGVSALVNRSHDVNVKMGGADGRFRITVGVDGTVYQKHPRFQHLLREKVNELCPGCDVAFKKSHDGSGKGAAMVTAVACRMTNDIMLGEDTM